MSLSQIPELEEMFLNELELMFILMSLNNNNNKQN